MQWVGLTTLGQPRLSEGAQPYLKDKGQGKYFGSQVSGLRFRVRVIRFGHQVRDPNPYLYLIT